MMPGRTLHRLAALICCDKTLERIVEPAIADLQKEYSSASRFSRRVWVLVTGYVAVLKVIVVCTLSVSSTTGDERHALWRTLAWSLGWVVAISALLTLPPLFDRWMRRWDAVLALIPQALPLAIPMGIAMGIALSLSALPARNIVKATLLGAVAASALSFGVLVWVMPAANHAFREITIRELKAAKGYREVVMPRGPNEMTLSELRSEGASFAAAGQTRLPREFAFNFHLRFALAAGTLVLASLLLAVPFNNRGLRGMVAFVGCFLYWTLLHTGAALTWRMAVPPMAGAWLPNIVLMTLAIGVAASRSSRCMEIIDHLRRRRSV